ncbi:MAG: hypothetical protein K0R44_3876 [Thermomicrobiales bacterium]|nr:hypothetical protein [Thermomicrobiales bacterium]
MRIHGQAHHAAAFEVEGNIDSLPIEAIELGNGVASSGEEAEWEHGHCSTDDTVQALLT